MQDASGLSGHIAFPPLRQPSPANFPLLDPRYPCCSPCDLHPWLVIMHAHVLLRNSTRLAPLISAIGQGFIPQKLRAVDRASRGPTPAWIRALKFHRRRRGFVQPATIPH